ncbi:right-handed parallel beta-helix repeat-containing protein [Leptolyngbya sp. FACHB-8]|nr:right-handed parallel beta-helix repeat-containing protein [Leptolyngbya sp. FACHB-8]
MSAETLTVASPSTGSQLLLGNTENTQLLSSGTQDALTQQTSTSSARLRSESTLRTFAATTALAAPSPIRVEAENMQLNTYRIESSTLASGGRLVGLKGVATNEVGTASSNFQGASGTYNIKIGYFDENDGAARIETRVGGSMVATTTLNQQLGSNAMTSGNRVERIVASGVTVQQGDRIELRGLENSEEHARVDYVEFIPVSAPPADTTAPTAALTASNITAASSNSKTFTVAYSDNAGIDASTIDNADVRVTGPNGFSQTATLVSVNSTTDGTPRTATYQVNAPGGSWDSADNGTYSVAMQTGAVNDTSDNSVAAGSLGSFDVAIPTSGGGGAITPPPAPSPLAPPAGFGATGTSSGRILYVSTTGNDNNSGISATSAFRTASKALSMVRPGETIVFAAGNYPSLTISGKNGTASAPITIKTSGAAVFSSGSYSSGAGVSIRDSSNIILDGVVAKRSLFGIMGERITNTTIRNSEVYDIGQEGIHVRAQSSYVLIAQNKIHDTGMRGGTYANYGEGVYVGFGAAGGENDGTHHVAVHRNEIYRTSVEAIDLKRGLHNIIAEYNNIHDINTKVRAIINVMDGPTGTEYGYVVRGNTIRNISGETYNSDGVGIRIFGGGVDVYNNVISNAEDAGIRNQASVGGPVRIYNNTVFNGGTRGNIVDDTGKADIRNNIGSTKAGNIASTASLFMNATGGDLRLSSSATAAINKGTSISMVNIDAVGRARPQGGIYDMGAYESQ